MLRSSNSAASAGSRFKSDLRICVSCILSLYHLHSTDESDWLYLGAASDRGAMRLLNNAEESCHVRNTTQHVERYPHGSDRRLDEEARRVRGTRDRCGWIR